MDVPSPTDVRSRSELLTQRFPGPDGDPALAVILEDDAGVVSELTGRAIGPADQPGEPVPDYLVPVAIRAMAMRAERAAIEGAAKTRTGAIGALRLRSFTAGPYSETYADAGNAAALKALDPDARIHELLWALATDDRRAYWLRVWGIADYAPAAGVQSFAWEGAARGVTRGPRRFY